MPQRLLCHKICTLLILISCTLFATQWTGVVSDSGSGKPVENVRVSLGHTTCITYTDSNGQFSLSDETATIKKPTRLSQAGRLYITQSSDKITLLLSGTGDINTVSLFNLAGRCVFKKVITDPTSLFSLPQPARGIYVISITTKNNTAFASKISFLRNGRTAITIPLNHIQSPTSAALTPLAEPLIFYHDRYFPLRKEIYSNSDIIDIRLKTDPRAALFDEAAINTFRFNLSTEDSLYMEHNALLEQYVPATFSFNDSLIGEIGIRYKGSSYSIERCFDSSGTRNTLDECQKISLKLKFNNYSNDLRFYSMKTLNLHSMSGDNTKMHDILGYRLYREMGIISPRTSYAKIYINNVFQGLFLAVENIDGRFTKSRWPEEGDGNLYKECWPTSKSTTYYKNGLATNDKPEDSADVSGMVKFYQTLSTANTETFKNDISRFIDINYFLRYIAVDRAIHNSDGIMTWYSNSDWSGNHNYFFYEEQKSPGRFWLIPWDLNATFSLTDPIIDDLGVPEWNVPPKNCEPVPIWSDQAGIPAHCNELIGLTADCFWKEYVTICEKMLTSIFTTEHISEKINGYAHLIDPIVASDPYIEYEYWKQQSNYLLQCIPRLQRSFDEYIHEVKLVPDTTGFLEPFSGNGYLLSTTLNNFEFTPGAEKPAWASHYSSQNSTSDVSHSTSEPLHGTGDVCYQFTFNDEPSPGQYREWTILNLLFKESQSLPDLDRIQVNLKSDSQRNIRINLESPAYDKHGISTRYGWEGATNSTDNVKIFRILNIDYPAWETSNPPNILEEVLASVSGISFQPSAHFDNSGNLSQPPDSGYLRVDNIRFTSK